MKTKIILLSTVIALFTITVASTKTEKSPKTTLKNSPTEETRVNKGLASDDKNQFN
jgi:hypothetical protein